ncbi:hypothetical protein I9W82_003928 [Candida metapsilosis]|uniref:Alcohol dehydrogenase-like N-terminal domain-containing protein n=1 Tax=Candida metapsilosis TaxID=273372 RepID=A0A8H8DB00_9ASCO|nr:hypothetical protein I9W82_003928 [Candida metapsilosis]
MSDSEQTPTSVPEADLPQEAPSYEEAAAAETATTTEPQSPPKAKPKVKKSVGFAPPPEEDLREYHKYLKQKEEAELKSSPFHKIPAELAYLEKRYKQAPPKPIDQTPKQVKPNSRFKLSDLPDLSKLKFFDVKDLSVKNKETELQFHYTTIDLPPSSNSVIVDIKYGSLNSFDLSKINQYLLNMSKVKVVLGYEFAGVVTNVGSSMQKKYAVGDYVFGLIDPSSRRGALSSSQIIYPGRDVLVKVGEEVLNQLEDIDIDLDANDDNKAFEVGEEEVEEEERETSKVEEPEETETEEAETAGEPEAAAGEAQAEETEETDAAKKTDELHPKDSASNADDLVSKTSSRSSSEFKKGDDMPPLAKLSAISLLYNRAKQMLQSLNTKNSKANILINGADTDIGLTIIQVLLAEYQFEFLSLVLIIREKSSEYMDKLIARFEKKYYDPSKIRRLKCIPFDVVNDGLYFAGERVPISYKKPDFFATEVIDSLLIPHSNGEFIDTSNINDYKLDLFIDLIGCKKYFQSTSTKLHEIETLNLPFKQHISTSIENLFDAKTKEPFLTRILKPKKFGSSVVSGCKFTLKDPSYNIDKLIDFSEQSVMNPWTSKWSSNILNNWTSYNYYEEVYLKIKQEWTEQALQLVLEGKLKYKIDKVVDWRKDFKRYVKELKDNDGKIILKVEDF